MTENMRIARDAAKVKVIESEVKIKDLSETNKILSDRIKLFESERTRTAYERVTSDTAKNNLPQSSVHPSNSSASPPPTAFPAFQPSPVDPVVQLGMLKLLQQNNTPGDGAHKCTGSSPPDEILRMIYSKVQSLAEKMDTFIASN